jgi:predicted amidophosphoribosyltransferase
METHQTKCFSCLKEITLVADRKWLENDGLCPNCATILSIDDTTCYNCDKPAIQDDEILFCPECFELREELDEED